MSASMTKGDLGYCSRWSRLRARKSSPKIGCVVEARRSSRETLGVTDSE